MDVNTPTSLMFTSNLPATYGTFTFENDTSPPSQLVIGDDCSGGCYGTSLGVNDAYLTFSENASGVIAQTSAVLGSAMTGFTSTNYGASSFSPVTITPLPAALPLFAGGLGALGLLGWRRKRKAAAAA